MANSPSNNSTDEELQFILSPLSFSPPPHPPPVILSGPGGSSGGGSGQKSKKGDQGESGKRSQLDAPKSDPICSLCGKQFGSWKGVSNHMRAHPERNSREAFPPVKPEVADCSPIRDQPVPVAAHHLIVTPDLQTWEEGFPTPSVEADPHRRLTEMRQPDILQRLQVLIGIIDKMKPALLPPPPKSTNGGLGLDLPPAPASQEDFQEGSTREKSVN